MPRADNTRHCVLVLAPTGRDASLVCEMLTRAGIGAVAVRDIDELEVALPDADAAIIAEEAFTEAGCERFRVALRCQSVWSDLPLIVLSLAHNGTGLDLSARLSPEGNITMVERPVRPITLVSVTRAALRARRRQYLTRDHMAELAEARARLDSTLAAAEIGTWMWDGRTGRFLADANLMRIFGIEPDSGAGLGDYLQRVHPDDLPDLRDQIERTRNDGSAVEAEFRMVPPDNGVRWMLARGRVRRSDDGAAGVIPGVVVDITERIEAEQAQQGLMIELERQARVFDTTLSAMPDFAFILDQDRRFLYANRALLELWGLPLDRVVGRSFADLDYPEDLTAKLERNVDEAFATGAEVRDETAYVSPTGVWGYYEYIMVPVTTEGSDVRVVVGSTREITGRKRLEDQRAELLASERSARAEAERVGRLKDEFLSTLSHELRTPLNAISGWVQLLIGGNLSPEEHAKAIETISRNTRAQKELIEDLLDMSRIVSGKVRLDIQPIDLGVVVLDAVESVRPAAEAKRITLSTRLDARTDDATGDPTRLQQVVWNLVNNAVKFTPRGGSVEISLTRREDEFEIVVKDDGAGIEPEFLGQVFDRFRQADASSRRRHGGLGLGLSIVKQIMEMHGGRVCVTSPGQGLGATFTAILPAALAAADPQERPARGIRQPGGVTERRSLAGVRILLVDDDPDGREIVARMLEESGAAVLSAGSADDADTLLDAEEIDLLLSDIGMPERDGYDLIQTVRSSPRQSLRVMPAAALTAFARVEDRETALHAGYDAHVTKPVDPAELLAVLDSLRCKNSTDDGPG